MDLPGARSARWPFVQLDTTGRPDVADLFRFLRTEGGQHHSGHPPRYLLFEGHGYMEVNIGFEDPVTCAFKFVLRWPEHFEVFDLMDSVGQLMYTAQDVHGTIDPEHVSGVLTDDGCHHEVLAAWRHLSR